MLQFLTVCFQLFLRNSFRKIVPRISGHHHFSVHDLHGIPVLLPILIQYKDRLYCVPLCGSEGTDRTEQFGRRERAAAVQTGRDYGPYEHTDSIKRPPPYNAFLTRSGPLPFEAPPTISHHSRSCIRRSWQKQSFLCGLPCENTEDVM